jgi:iron complex transport system permease protein
VLAASGISFLKYIFEDSVTTMVFWLMGGLSEATWLRVSVLCVIFLIAIAILWHNKRTLALLYLDDATAQASGVSIGRSRELLFIITTVLVAVSVSFCGTIGFIGLMIPHAVRGFMRHSVSTQLLGAPLCGAIALVLFDMIARILLPHGGELPVGIITSLIGGVFLFLLLIRKGNAVWS